MVFAMLPGDARQTALAALLREAGHDAPDYAAGLAADYYVFPMPTGAHPVLEELPDGAAAMTAMAAGVHPRLRLRDYAAAEEVLAENAAITAEGALGLAILQSDRTLRGARVLVLGYGRIGRALAPRLRALGAEVTVYARRADRRVWAEDAGCSTLQTLPPEVAGYDYLFNTIPVPLLDRAPEGCFCLELASAPGGFRDPDGVRIARGLPGKTAPSSAARVLRDGILRIIREDEI